jgi:hypothetical protein
MKDRLAELLRASHGHRLSRRAVEAEWRLDVPTFGDVPHTAGPKAMLNSLSEDPDGLVESGIGYDSSADEFYLLG